MNIGDASEETGLPAKTIRYYEEIGLVTADRAMNGYRDYSRADVHRLRFLKRARNLGFSVAECRSLLALYDDEARESAVVKAVAKKKLIEIDRKLAELGELRNALSHFVETCHGDKRPDCPIIDGLSGSTSSTRSQCGKRTH